MIVKVCEKHEVELWAGEECEICALRTHVEALQKALRGLWQMVNRYNRTTSCVDCCKEYNAGEWKNHSDNCPMRAVRNALAPDAEKEG